MAVGDFPEGATATHKDGRKIVFRDGEWRVLQGASPSKEAQESERTAGFLATRLAGGVAKLKEVGGGDSPSLWAEFVRGAAGDTAANYATGTDRQRVEAAQADMLDAALTLGTGAAYNPEQLKGYTKAYFPQLGDSDGTIADKRQRLNLLLQAARLKAGSASGQIDAALKAAGMAIPDEQAKGGDPASGVPGAATDGSGAPPTPPGEVKFLDELPQESANAKPLTDEQKSALQAVAQSGGSADQIIALGRTFGVNITAENAGALAKFYADPKNRNIAPVVNESNTVKPVDAGDGALGAAARGAGNALTLGFLDEAGALADTVTQGGTYSDNLDRRRGQELYDEQNHSWSRLTGQLVGGLPVGGIEFMSAKAASRAAGVAAMRANMGKEAAQAIANRVYAARTAAEAAGIGGVYGFGDAQGGLGERAAGAGIGAAVGGALGGAIGYGGSRFAQRLASRRSAAVAARPAALDEALRTGGPTNEAGQLAKLAREQNIAVLPQDIAGGPMIGRMTQGMAQTPFGANPIRRATDQLYDSFRNRVSEIGGEAGTANEVGGIIKSRSADLAAREGIRARDTSGAVQAVVGAPVDVTGAGQIAQRGATRWMEQTAERANELYARVPIEQDADAALNSTRAVLRDLTAGMRSNPELGALFANPRLNAYLRAISDEVDPQTGELLREGRLSWRDLQEFRTRVGDALDEPRLSEKIAPRQLRALYASLSADMRATAEAAGPDALRAWRRANDFYDGRMKRINTTLNAVLGDRRDRTPNEALTSLQGMLRSGSTGDAARFSRVLRSMTPEDARTVRATIVNEARGGRQFDADALARNWGDLSERGKSALLPEPGLRNIMDDAAERASASTRDPFANRSSEQVYSDFERMAGDRGDSMRFRRQLASLSPEEATSVRSLFINRMGRVKDEASGGEVFSIARFLKRWDKEMTPEAKSALFGDAEMRADMTALAKLAERVKASEALRGHSNTGAINSLNATTGGLGGAAIALLTGHPIVAAGLAAPAAYQRVSAEILTSPRLLKWLAKAEKKPNIQAQKAHVASLTRIARAEPAIANDVLALQQRLSDAFGGSVTRLAADERRDRTNIVDGQQGQPAGPQQRLQP